jgi:hypothetical protein
MIIGVPREVKDHETRVGVTPTGVKALTDAGHKVLVEQNAGMLSSFPDHDYQAVGAEIVSAASDVWRLANMIVKVKEPVEQEYSHFREGLVLFTYLHLAPLEKLTDALLDIRLYQLGAKFLAGSAATDYGVMPGSGLHLELALLHRIGLSPREANRRSEQRCRYLCWHDIGRIEPGSVAECAHS